MKVVESYRGALMYLVTKDSDDAKEVVTESKGFTEFSAKPEKK